MINVKKFQTVKLSKKKKIKIALFLCIFHSIIVALLIVFSPIKIILSIKYIFFGLLFWIVIFFINIPIIRKFRLIHKNKRLIQEINIFKSLFDKKIYAVLIVIFAISEELIFRSYFLSYMNQILPLIVSILINAFIFSLIHPKEKRIPLFVSGLIYCAIAIYFNIMSAIIAHIINNMIVYYLNEIKINEYSIYRLKCLSLRKRNKNKGISNN